MYFLAFLLTSKITVVYVSSFLFMASCKTDLKSMYTFKIKIYISAIIVAFSIVVNIPRDVISESGNARNI